MYFENRPENAIIKNAILYLSLAVFLLLLLKTAWLCDDAYITFRTVDNFINGYGLRWNVAERVQSYTHPLWMLLVSLIVFFTREVFFTSIFLSIIISLITVYLILFKHSKSFVNLLLIIPPILLSKTFVDFSTSGLENSLSHLIFTILLFVYLYEKKLTQRKLIIGVLTAFILLNRFDFIFILIPLLISELYKSSKKELLNFVIGFSPFIIWIVFSLWYYGFIFPNTAYAKLNTGISRILLLKEGLYYFKESFALDPVTIVTIILSILSSILKRAIKFLPVILGILFYFGYMIFVGGDFMAGRFFTTPFVLSIIILARLDFKNIAYEIIILITLTMFGIISLYRTINMKSIKAWENLITFDSGSVKDERKFYYGGANLLDALQGSEKPSYNWVRVGLEMRIKRLVLEITGNIGFKGYYAGPEIFIIDKFALSDPLLSRLPSEPGWRIGHFLRKIPEGYLESIQTNTNKIVDPDLHLYYEKLKKITRGNLFDFERLIDILSLNFGKYNYLIERYISKNYSFNQVN